MASKTTKGLSIKAAEQRVRELRKTTLSHDACEDSAENVFYFMRDDLDRVLDLTTYAKGSYKGDITDILKPKVESPPELTPITSPNGIVIKPDNPLYGVYQDVQAQNWGGEAFQGFKKGLVAASKVGTPTSDDAKRYHEVINQDRTRSHTVVTVVGALKDESGKLREESHDIILSFVAQVAEKYSPEGASDST